MNTIENWKICVTGDCVDLATAPSSLAAWIERNSVVAVSSSNQSRKFFVIDSAYFQGTAVKVIMRVDEDGSLGLYSLRRNDWVAMGSSPADYGAGALKHEYYLLRALVERYMERPPEKVTSRESKWGEKNYDIVVSYEPMAFEVGIFFSRLPPSEPSAQESP